MPRGRPRKSGEDVLLKSAELLGWALGGLEREIVQTRERLASLTAQAARLRERLGKRAAKAVAAPSTDQGEPTAAAPERARRTMSPEARRRISEMMKKRWAERRKRNA
jgi:hypothetical protein